jgi:murein DD-endopeptidase MepM/ murein hydrolase activator NlpD
MDIKRFSFNIIIILLAIFMFVLLIIYQRCQLVIVLEDAYQQGLQDFQLVFPEYCNNIKNKQIQINTQKCKLKFRYYAKQEYGISVFKDHKIFSITNDRYSEYVKTSYYGYRDIDQDIGGDNNKIHTGTDISMRVGTPIYSEMEGKVIALNYDRNGYGLYIKIQYTNNQIWLFGHLSKVIIKPMQLFKAEQIIALSGNTGRSTGAHLHIECIQ